VTRFFDTNVLVYAQQTVPHSAVARAVLAEGGVISVQVLNEFTNVLRRKLRRSWAEIEEALDDFAMLLPPARALTVATHRVALGISRDVGYAFYDALILASALEAGCTELVSEDMQHGRVVGSLTIRNPFV
jgi:predicted nucleic acid-binding protein